MKSIIYVIVTVKTPKALPIALEMAELPKARLVTYQKLFSYDGMDYFGPMTVSVGRQTKKS